MIFTVDTALIPDVAVTKTANYNGAALDLGAGWAPQPYEPLGIAIQTTAYDHVDGNETYQFIVEESPDNSTWTATGCSFFVTAVGVYENVVKSTMRYVRARLVVAGTTPSLTYSVLFGPAT
jgi:hypothetical protein